MIDAVTRQTLLGAIVGAAVLPQAAVAEAEPKRGGTMTLMFYTGPPSLVSLVSTNSLTVSAKVTEGQSGTSSSRLMSVASVVTATSDAVAAPGARDQPIRESAALSPASHCSNYVAFRTQIVALDER